jgi:hypothetical protein
MVHFINIDKSEILVVDFTEAKTTEEIILIADEAKKTAALHQPQSLLCLVDFTGLKINRERTKIVQDMAAHNRQYLRFIALVGLGFPRSSMLRLMLKLAGKKNHRVFGTREKALRWLVGRG